MQNYTGVKLKSVIDCNKNHNPLIKKKLREVSVEEGLYPTELFQIHNERKDGIGFVIKWELIAEVALSMFVNLWYSSIRRLYQRKLRLLIMKVVYLILKGIPTQRYRDIVVSTHKKRVNGTLVVEENSEGKSGWDKGNIEQDQENRILESVCIQHEIDHEWYNNPR